MASSPKWWQLYALFPLLVLLLVLEQQLPISAGEHQAVQIGIILLIYGLIHLWLRANAVVLAETDKGQSRPKVAVGFYPSWLSAASSDDGGEEKSVAGVVGDDDGSLPVVKITDVRYDNEYPFPTSTRPGGAGFVDRDYRGDLSFNCDGNSTSNLPLAG
jgi:hypothetical protein